MHKGYKDISFVTEEMLYRVKFTEHTNTVYSAGFWDRLVLQYLITLMIHLGCIKFLKAIVIIGYNR